MAQLWPVNGCADLDNGLVHVRVIGTTGAPVFITVYGVSNHFAHYDSAFQPYLEIYMTRLLLVQKVESNGGPIFKVVLEW